MANPLKTLSGAVEVVAFLLAAFGGFLTTIAPPDETGIKLTLGLASMACLIVFLIISALAKDLGKTWWLVLAGSMAAVFMTGAVVYSQRLDHDTFVWPPTSLRYVDGGSIYKTPEVADQAKRVVKVDLVRNYGGMSPDMPDPRPQIWDQDAIEHNRLVLMLLYLVTVLSAAIAVFAAIEGVSAKSRPASHRPPAKANRGKSKH